MSGIGTHTSWDMNRKDIETGRRVEKAPEVTSVELPTGVRVQYVEQGNPLGIPVLFLHGLGDSWRSFEPVLPHLPESIRAFALTQRGHGDSSRPEEGYRSRDFAADVTSFMDALELDSAVIVGHSLGSAIAQCVAISHPERVQGLVLEGSFLSLANSPVVQEIWVSMISTLDDPVDPGFVRGFQESTVAEPMPEALLETLVRESLKLPARVWKLTVSGGLQDDFSGELSKIEAPTLLVWGDQDEMVTRREQEAQMAAIAASRLVVYHAAGHSAHWEEPERFASDLAGFIGTLKLG